MLINGTKAVVIDGEATWPIHDRILGTQASMLSSNSCAISRLRMVADNEFMVPADEDALTVAEIFQHSWMQSMAIWTTLMESGQIDDQ